MSFPIAARSTTFTRTTSWSPTPEEAAAAAVKAGCDLCCGRDYNALVARRKEGLGHRKRKLTPRVGRLLEARFRLGLFDPPDKVPFAQIPARAKTTRRNIAALALRKARGIHRAA